MIAPPEVLVLEDDVVELRALEQVIRDARLEPIPNIALAPSTPIPSVVPPPSGR